MMLYFLYQYSNRLEKDDFAGKPADMSYMLLIIYAVTSKSTAYAIATNMPVSFIWIHELDQNGQNIRFHSNRSRFLLRPRSFGVSF